MAARASRAGIAPGLLGFTGDTVPSAAVRALGWPAFGLAGALLLDRDPRSRPGRTLAALAAVPAVVALSAGRAGWGRIEARWELLGLAPVVAAFALIAWAMDRPADRMARRRLIWFVLWSAVLVDAGIAAATIACGAGVGTLLRVIGTRTGLPKPDLSGAFAAVVTTALVLPGGLWLRRAYVQRRYGRGELTPADVAEITADLHTLTDARELLGKAAAMVATASGHRRVGLVLGPDEPEEGVLHPLVVGGDRCWRRWPPSLPTAAATCGGLSPAWLPRCSPTATWPGPWARWSARSTAPVRPSRWRSRSTARSPPRWQSRSTARWPRA
ncbi:hypothetical protein ACQP2F_19205 [Actinoplanes sp. CA-030573]|uniref:hypothetical protein n=1 Tax=Actinoplanes sp. CA-030573 TaxID=3239898 RepID=UPI003D8A11CB